MKLLHDDRHRIGEDAIHGYQDRHRGAVERLADDKGYRYGAVLTGVHLGNIL